MTALVLGGTGPTGHFVVNGLRQRGHRVAILHSGRHEIDEGFVASVMETFQAGSDSSSESMPWEDQARERIARAPDMVRGMLIQEIEGWSRRNGLQQVSGEAVDAVKQTWAERGVFHLDPDDRRNSN